ncbi:carboxypeptidase-like regulatory domain-containing protein, partial [Microvirga sp. 3-52]|nr:carboxypeptidase-like regulatory domain-containing protein [Microvirga sp. 3-52]
SDGGIERPGWYIDDVGLTNTSTQSATAKTVANAASNKLGIELGKEKVEVGVEKGNTAPTTLPIRAQVSVLETGRSVYSNPADGSYKLMLQVGDFTVEAGAYGYETKQQTVSIADGEETLANFTLDELPKGTITGQVTNSENGNTIADATLLLIEDANIQPVETDENGNFSLTAYEGTYTLRVMALNFHSQEVEITIGSDPSEVNLELDPYYIYPG